MTVINRKRVRNSETTKPTRHKVISMLQRALGENCYNFEAVNATQFQPFFITFEYEGLDFKADSWLVISQINNGKSERTVASVLMTKLMYSENRDEIESWFSN